MPCPTAYRPWKAQDPQNKTLSPKERAQNPKRQDQQKYVFREETEGQEPREKTFRRYMGKNSIRQAQGGWGRGFWHLGFGGGFNRLGSGGGGLGLGDLGLGPD